MICGMIILTLKESTVEKRFVEKQLFIAGESGN
jgi:hypothetical protein